VIESSVDPGAGVALYRLHQLRATTARMNPPLAAQIARRLDAGLAAITAAQPPRSRQIIRMEGGYREIAESLA
jgi:hypothetical protein